MHLENIVGHSSALKHVLELVETVAPSDSTVLLLGETGTGKELIARALYDRSRRRDQTFVKLNCAAIPTGLLESELFGHEKGSFTGAITTKIGRMELADRGTLFLDEVGDIPIETQAKLLRALQEREFERLGCNRTRRVNFRLIAATNRDLETMFAYREFRSDLYYRLYVFPVRIPPLRERKEDIPQLVGHFVQKFAAQMQKEIQSISPAVVKELTDWNWPGNIRELENFIERAVILTRGKSLEAPLGELRKTNALESRAEDRKRGQVAAERTDCARDMASLRDQYERRQRDEIIRALTACKGRVGGRDGAAARLGMNRTTFFSRLKKFGIYPKQYLWSPVCVLFLPIHLFSATAPRSRRPDAIELPQNVIVRFFPFSSNEWRAVVFLSGGVRCHGIGFLDAFDLFDATCRVRLGNSPDSALVKTGSAWYANCLFETSGRSRVTDAPESSRRPSGHTPTAEQRHDSGAPVTRLKRKFNNSIAEREMNGRGL